jgi:2-dehydro-3-deoxyglucarate aldolase/4-hydroxy-2-oxoheptanedioate aldolase
MVGEVSSVSVAQISAVAGLEFVQYDMEHSGRSLETLRILAAAHRGLPVVPMARVPVNEYVYIAGALDAGMFGITIPNVRNGDDARRAVECALYPPLGRRGAGLFGAHDDFEPGDVQARVEELNRRTSVIALVESGAGVENVRDIASTPGIDAIFVGPFDLSLDLGVPGDFSSPAICAATEEIARACREHSIAAGIGIGSGADVEKWLRLGYRAFTFSDVNLLLQGWKQGVEEARRTMASLSVD